MANVLNLPEDLQTKFLTKLNSIKDSISFGAVCRSWNLIYNHNRPNLARQNPVLILSIKGLGAESTKFYCLSSNTIHTSDLEDVFTGSENVCFGSTGSWVVVHADNGQVILLNPFVSQGAGNKVTLPHLGSHVEKVVLSANPVIGSYYFAMAISDGFDVYKSEIGQWFSYEVDDSIDDVIWVENKFYMLNTLGEVYKFDPNSVNPQMVRVCPKLDGDNGTSRYIVELGGVLVQVIRLTVEDVDGNSCTDEMIVYKFDQFAMKWTRIRDLAGHALFVGTNASTSVLASDFPNCEPNSVYFSEGPHDLGICHLHDGSIERILLDMDKVDYALPCWLEPSLVGCNA